MELFYGFDKIDALKPSAITIGTYDGVHKGHRKVLSALSSLSRQHGLASLIITLSPHPRIVLNSDSNVKLIDTEQEKYEKFGALGIDFTVVIPFDKDFARMSYKAFVEDLLVKRLNIDFFVFGKDHRFGHKREGNLSALDALAKKHQFNIKYVHTFVQEGIDISSTKIRQALENGEVEKANMMLGQEFSLSALVVDGHKHGSCLGFPTANLFIDNPYKIIPAQGVYAVKVWHDGSCYKGMMNIGKNPTMKTDDKVSLEVHIFDFKKNIYNNILKVLFVKKIRDEIKFESPEALKAQLKKDKAIVASVLSNSTGL